MKQRKILAGIIVVLFLAVAVLAVFVVQSRKKVQASEQEEVDVSAVTSILLQSIDKNYPPTPKEVLKYYSEITCCFYNDGITEEQLIGLADRALELYDDELVANMSREQYLEDLKQDILQFSSQDIVVSGYTVTNSADVEYFRENGDDCARLYVTYRLRQKTEFIYTTEVFIMRKDADGHWKIFGWTLAPEEEVSEDE